MENYLKLLKFIRGHERLFFAAVGVMLIAGIFEAVQIPLLVPIIDVVFTGKKIIPPESFPEGLMWVIDWMNNMERRRLLNIFIIGFVIMVTLKSTLLFLYKYLMGDVAQRIMRDVRGLMYNKIQDLSLAYFSQKRTGELVSRITHDATLIENAVSYAVTDLFKHTFVLIYLIIITLIIDYKSAMLIFVLLPLIGIPMSNIGRRLKKISRGMQESMADINSFLLETISGIRLVKAFCTEEYEKQRYYKQNHRLYKLKVKSLKRMAAINPVSELIAAYFGTGMILWYANRMLNEELSFGIFIAFFGSIMMMISPIKRIGNANAITQQALSANERIYELLDELPTVVEKEGAKEIEELNDSIVLKDVEFKYDEDDKIVFSNVDIEIKKGDLVAIVGPTGVGKSTLVNLLPRLYDPTKGEVLMDGVNIREASFRSLRHQFGIVTQETILFNDTVRANIAYGYQDATQEEIEEAAKKAFAHRFIETLPKKYDTMIGDRGFRLSGGEKQRISIARAILKNPPILILDEATSQLDSESEKFVQEALDKLMQGRTVVAIAHRLSTIMQADKIIVLDKGKVAGQGKHQELLKTCALYEKLHSMQFSS